MTTALLPLGAFFILLALWGAMGLIEDGLHWWRESKAQARTVQAQRRTRSRL